MSGAVLDTHAAVWYLLRSPRLSQAARAAIVEAREGGGELYVSCVSVAEVIYLVEKSRLPNIALERLATVLSDPRGGIRPVPFDLGIALALSRVSREQVADLPDRIVAATALYLDLPLITRDRKIRASGIQTVW